MPNMRCCQCGCMLTETGSEFGFILPKICRSCGHEECIDCEEFVEETKCLDQLKDAQLAFRTADDAVRALEAEILGLKKEIDALKEDRQNLIDDMSRASENAICLRQCESWLRLVQQAVATTTLQTAGEYVGKNVFLPLDTLEGIDSALDGEVRIG